MERPPIVSIALFFSAFAFLFWVGFSAHIGKNTVRASAVATSSIAKARHDRIVQMASKSAQEPNYFFFFDALNASLGSSFDTSGAIGTISTPGFDPNDDYSGLPKSEGYDLVAAYCGACHSLDIVMQQHASAARWSELIDWMVEKQGMAQLGAEDERIIEDYLSTNFGPKK